jgi:hypothetical protein
MKRIKVLAPLALVACSIAAWGAPSASATLPELGRCVLTTGVVEGKHTKYSGEFGDPNCLRISSIHAGKYEWMPGPGTKPMFVGFGVEPTPTLQTTSGEKIICSSLTLNSGEYTGPKTAKVKSVVFSGCEQGALPCQTLPSKEGEIEGVEFTMDLGTIKGGTHPTVGWDLKKEGVAFAFQCGKAPEIRDTRTIEGSLIGSLKSATELDVNRMSTNGILLYKQKMGIQQVESFERGPKDVFTETIITGLTKTVAQTGVSNNVTVESGVNETGTIKPGTSEPTEIKTVP